MRSTFRPEQQPASSAGPTHADPTSEPASAPASAPDAGPSTRSAPAELPARTAVAIVGAGPTGLALAVTLAQAGIDAVVLDRLVEGANTSRAAVVHARTLEVLEQVGAAQELIARGVTVDRFCVRDGDRRLLTLSFSRLPTAYPYALMIPQSVTEAVLLERLLALGGQVHRLCEVTAVSQDADGCRLTLGDGRSLRADRVVGADGMHSLVRQAAGIGFTGSRYDASFVLADVAMDWAPGRDEVSLTFDPEGLTVIAPLPGGRYRVVATVDQAPASPDLAFVQDLLQRRAPGQARVHDLAWSSRFQVHHRVADRYRDRRLLLAGDAAHVHSPAGGQGMNTGIQDAHALGLALAAHDLDRYEAVRRPIALRVVAFTDRMTRLATTRNPLLRTLRNLALPLLERLPVFRTRLAMELSELTYR